MILIVLGLAFGIDTYLSRLIPFPLLHPVPLMAYLSLAVVLFSIREINFRENFFKYCYALLAVGCTISAIRWYYWYGPANFQYLPIFRHLAALILGVFTLIGLKVALKKYSNEQISRTIVLSSFPFLLYGAYQAYSGHKIGQYLRIKSLFLEPSYYGDYLTLIVAPCLGYLLVRKWKNYYAVIAFFWLINFYFAQSGTAILKMVSLLLCCVLIYPFSLRSKILGVVGGVKCFAVTIFLGQGYVYDIFQDALKIARNPELFESKFTIYDRFYPFYISLKSFFTWNGLWGFGYGGDYFELANLYSPQMQTVMIAHHASMSYFLSLTPKLILFFGVFGIGWIYLLIKNFRATKNPFIRIGFLNILITSLWGIPTFSMPYLWFWLALALNAQEDPT